MLEEDQAEGDMLIVRRLQVLAQLVGGEEHLRLEAEIGSVAVAFGIRGFLGFFRFSGRLLLLRASSRHLLIFLRFL
jgi:hypothetical protein